MSERRRDNLDILLDDEISFDRACAMVADRQLHGNPAAASTIDALMYSLRSGTKAIGRADVQRRLAEVDERQMREMCRQLEHRDPRVAKSWTTDEIGFFIRVWNASHD